MKKAKKSKDIKSLKKNVKYFGIVKYIIQISMYLIKLYLFWDL